MKYENGSTLAELLVVLAIIAMIALGAAVTTTHMFNVSHQNNEWTRTSLQDQSVGYWVSRDMLMAQQVSMDDPVTSDTEFATLNWKEFQSGNCYYVHYALVDSGSSLYCIERRYEARDDSGSILETKNSPIADGISQCYITFDQPNRWILTVESQSGLRSTLLIDGILPRCNFSQP